MAEDVITCENQKLTDEYGRLINYLRLSVTDRCNLKCIYCSPPQGIKYLAHSEICSYSEFLKIVKIASQLGLNKIRLTGGEPFLRRDVIKLVASLQNIKNIKEITVTTNGTLLLPYLNNLREIGIRRINISLDTLKKELFCKLTGSEKFFNVLESINQALYLGFKVKINMVVLKGINDGEITQFIEYFLKKQAEVRFIEFMPLCGPRWKEEHFFPYERIKEIIARNFELLPLPTSGVAQEFALRDGSSLEGKVGIIAPVTRSFCPSCSRLRLSPNGELRPCLFSRTKVELLPLLRDDSSWREKERKIIEAFIQAVKIKPMGMPQKHVVNDVYIRSLGG